MRLKLCNYVSNSESWSDLVIKDPDGVGVRGSIREINVYIGHQRIDFWSKCDTTPIVDAILSLHGRSVSRHGDSLFVPLALAPFHDHNLLPLVSLKYHDVEVDVIFVNDEFAKDAELYGKAYYRRI